MKTDELVKRIDYIIKQGNEIFKTLHQDEYGDSGYDNTGKFAGFKSMSLSFISNLYGKKHSYYNEFKGASNNTYEYNIKESLSILKSIKHEIENGWLDNLKKIVSSELFSDFLEMSKYLLDQGYKDASAVMIGSVLEENLRQLCKQYKIETTFEKNDKIINKKADAMNNELYKENLYNSLEHKSVTSWLDLRNKSAHGKYTEYDKNNVQLMYDGVLNFLNKIK